MTRKFVIWAILILLLYVVQSSNLPYVSVHGISADLLMLFVVSFSFQNGSKNGAFIGFVSGLLQDLATGTFFGINIFIKMLVGYVCGKFSKQVFKEQVFLVVVAVALASTFHYTVSVAIMFMLGYYFNLLMHFNTVFIPMILFNVVFSLPVHMCVCQICERLKEKK